MKIIIDTDTGNDNITALVASSEDASFPVENLRDDYTTNLWKATGTAAQLTLSVSKGSAVELLNTNATSATVSVGTGGDYANQSGYANQTGYAMQSDGDYPVTTTYNLPGSGGRLWADYPQFDDRHVVTIALEADTNVEAGIVRGGMVEEFRDPAYGLKEGSIDYSIEAELNNGASYYRKRNVVRKFENLSMIETRANAFKFKHDIFDAVGPKPLAIRLIHNAITDDEFVLFAKRIESPQIDYSISKEYARLLFSLKEVV